MAFDAHSTPAPIVQVIEHPAISRARLHRRLSVLVDRLITIMDGLDADPDLEEAGDDEASLGFPEPGIQIGSRYHVLGQDKLHAWMPTNPDDREEADDDDEPSLCGVTFGLGNPRDLEEACEDEGAQCDDEGAIEEDDDRETEASLCGVTFGHGHAVNLGPYGGGFTYDLEDQCEDDGCDSDSEYSFGGVRMVGAGVDESAETCSPETGEGPQ